jgi:hypothetical protein
VRETANIAYEHTAAQYNRVNININIVSEAIVYFGINRPRHSAARASADCKVQARTFS